MKTFEEVRDRAIEHLQFMVDYVGQNPEAVKRAWAKCWDYMEIGLLTFEEAEKWRDCLSASAFKRR